MEDGHRKAAFLLLVRKMNSENKPGSGRKCMSLNLSGNTDFKMKTGGRVIFIE